MTNPEPSPAEAATTPTAGDPAARNGGDAAGRGSSSDEAWDALVARLVGPCTEILGQVRTLLSLRSEEARARLRRMRWALARGFVLGIAAATLTVAGGVLLARGLARTLAARLETQPWLGELLAGLILLALVAAGLALARARDERMELERLRRKYERDEPSRASDRRGPDPRAETQNGGGVPGRGADPSQGGTDAQPRPPG